jgi:predicted transposase/invertase (TIGR01784 family)
MIHELKVTKKTINSNNLVYCKTYIIAFLLKVAFNYYFSQMKDNLNNKHDKIVKDTFSRPEIAKAYFKQFLPTQLSEIIDIESLNIVNGSYITDEFKDLFSDLLFQFNLKNSKERLVVSLLFEHKARPDKNVLIQVGNYIFNQWSKEIKSKKPIVPIIPLIYYQGKQKWKVPTILDLFKNHPDEIKVYLPSFNFLFFGLNTLTKEQLYSITDAMLFIAMIGHDQDVDIKSYLSQISNIHLLKAIKDEDRNFITQIFIYKIYHTDISKEDIFTLIKEMPNPINREFMSTYDAIKLEGEQIGLEKGKIEGKIEGKSEVVLAMYNDKISVSQISKYTNLPIDDVVRIIDSSK